jgi:peptide deformylase
MSILKVAHMGHPVLRQVAEPVDPKDILDDEIQILIDDMIETMYEYNGVGLAAPQVHVSLQMALVGGDEDEDGNPIIRPVFNPKITPLTDTLYGMYEGCLSVPGLRGWVERPVSIHVEYLDADAKLVERDLNGFPAVVFQHECDHLEGKLFLDRMKDMRRLAFEPEAERFLPVETMIDGRDL